MTQTLRSSIKGALNRSIKGGLLKPAQFRGSTLDLDFAGAKSLKNQIGKEDVVSFTRASSATYVGSDGLIKTTPVNLLTYSDYSQVAGTTDAQLEGVVAAPDGTITARRYSAPSAGLDAINTITYEGIAGNDYTFSVWVRSTGTTSEVRLITGDTQSIALVQISTEWQRFEITKINNASNLVRAYVQMLNVGDEVEVWGAQVEEGTTATDYIPTTSTISGAPRFDHDPATGESLGLLIEESRTNLIANSAGDTPQTIQNLTGPVSVDGPAGSGTAYQYLSTGGTVASRLVIGSASVTTGSQYTATVYIKGVNYNIVTFGFAATGFSSNSRRLFYLDTLTSEGSGAGAAETSIEDVGNGWRRLRMTSVAANADASTILYLDLGSTSTETHTTNEGFQVYGIQVEQGSFPTSYIPTEGSTVTRAADVVEITGANFSSWFNYDQSTMYVEGVFIGDPYDGNYGFLATLDVGINDGRFYMRDRIIDSGDAVNFRSTISGSNTVTGNVVNVSLGKNAIGQNHKLIHALQVGVSAGAAANGNLGTTTTSVDANIQIPDRLQIGRHGLSYKTTCTIKRLVYFPTRLPDANLQNITA